ncbi:fibrobacter succinogenes major paralogous domain-containing protein [Winogradskyella sp. PG-2]|uniref:fibrobacter succinogenes major paralogous domain-containing protein n=1 Tax=Winogradskyella sp. PG-2 TaxID=754409 RepID=UPI00045894BE|nr:fibrobacter succinogenes major paralogous domain-containing protein [Winogradskyella sp. PG-2]BAO77234.1 SclB protein [Winogradskyella sp. PG-2]
MKQLLQFTLISLAAVLFINCSDDTDDNSQQQLRTVTDIDGNVYNTIVIGNQTWMLENLKVTTFKDGTPITQFTFAEHGNNWGSLNNQDAFYQYANTDDLNNAVDFDMPFEYYGAMYNHFAIESGKLAPEGWRIPSAQDFMELENYFATNGFSGNEATALKSTTGWFASSGNGTDAIGFNGLPNGYVSTPGTPTFAEGICTWATSDFNATNATRTAVQLFDQETILYSNNAIQIGAGVRCIKN